MKTLTTILTNNWVIGTDGYGYKYTINYENNKSDKNRLIIAYLYLIGNLEFNDGDGEIQLLVIK